MQTFKPRPVAFRGIVQHGEWSLKRYSIRVDEADTAGEAAHDSFEAGRLLALRALPEPACTPSRLGVGFLIEHSGRGADYEVLAWWDQENELPLRVWVREQRAGSRWRSAKGGESVCVWDLEIICFERELYVTTVLGSPDALPGDADARREAYLARHFPLGASSIASSRC